MFRRSDSNLPVFMLISDMALTAVALFLARELRLALPYGVIVPGDPAAVFAFPRWMYVLAATVWGVVFVVMSVYDERRTLRAVDELQAVVAAALFATLVFAGLTYFLHRDLSRLLFVYFFALDLSLLVLWRLLLRAFCRLRHGGWPTRAQRVAIVGAGAVGQRVYQLLADYKWARLTLVGFFDDDPPASGPDADPAPILGSLDDVVRGVKEHEIDELIIALPLRAHGRLVDLVLELQRLPLSVHVVPDLFDLAFFRTSVIDLDGIPMIGLRDPAIEGFPRLVKRLFDIVVASLVLVVALPVMGLLALAIRLDSPGPVVFRQQRVGENGRLFQMLKFRSMYQDADRREAEVVTETGDGRVIHKRPDDPRVTRVGRFIRATSLDELPQLFNVLKGEMSLVGPRPELPWLVDRYEPWQRKRFAVPQGMTGWWQVNGRSDKPMHLHTEEDLYYIQNYSLLLDIRILWKTVAAVLKRKGAY
jgi:exopolysaccharide biosynthesis polyprenyl glycosylphosphotransferase